MKKVDSVVLKETLFVSAWVLVFSALTQAVYLIIGKWDYTVLLGNAFGAAGILANFFAMAYTVQLALEKDEKDAKGFIKLSQSMRLLGLLVIAVVGYIVPVFNTVAVIIPFLFPSVAVKLRPLFNKN